MLTSAVLSVPTVVRGRKDDAYGTMCAAYSMRFLPCFISSCVGCSSKSVGGRGSPTLESCSVTRGDFEKNKMQKFQNRSSAFQNFQYTVVSLFTCRDTLFLRLLYLWEESSMSELIWLRKHKWRMKLIINPVATSINTLNVPFRVIQPSSMQYYSRIQIFTTEIQICTSPLLLVH